MTQARKRRSTKKSASKAPSGGKTARKVAGKPPGEKGPRSEGAKTNQVEAKKGTGSRRELVLQHMAESAYSPVKPKDLAKGLGIKQSEYTSFRRLLRELLHSGEVIRLRRGRLALPAKLELIRGRVHAHRRGFAFVVPEDGSQDIYIEPDHVKTAMHDDIVLVQKLSTSYRGSPEGQIVKVVRRGHPKVVGTFQSGRHFDFVVPEDERLPRDIYVPSNATKGAQPGQIVVVDLSDWDDPARSPEGKIAEVLGFPDDPGVDILTVIHEHGLALHFPSGVEAECADVLRRIPRTELDRREDCRELVVVTIDPKDAKDHDDAVSVVELKNGNYEVGVHIADVSYYVLPGTDLDREALLRGTSVYLVDRVVPMLPEVLSTDVCSLREGVDRLAMSCFMEMTPSGSLVKYRLAETVIRSAADMTYEEVQEYFDNGKIRKALSHVGPSLDILLALTRKLTKKRLGAGSLDFDLPEAKIELNDDGSVSAFYEQVRMPSHRLVEELMLLANKTVARYLHTSGIPTLYRVHDRPPEEKLKAFEEFMQSLGYKFKAGPAFQPKHLQKLLEEVAGKKEEGLVNEVLLRTMSKAVYQPENIGHFGLAFDRYLHFTSPIRRYPDLMVHRGIRRKLNRQADAAWVATQKAQLGRIGMHTSDRERVAMEAERDSVRIKQISYMETQLGESFTGLISGVRSFGLFVRLDKILIDGLIPIGSIDDDYYFVDEARYVAKGRHKGKTFRLGDAVAVQVVRVDPVKKEVDFRLESGGQTDKPAPKPFGRRAGRGSNGKRPAKRVHGGRARR